MIKVAASEIKARFLSVQHDRVKRWEKEHPEPTRPNVDKVFKELKAGKFEVDKEKLEEALGECGDADFIDVIATDSVSAWKTACSDREQALAAFKDALQAAKDSYLDRVLFDHENGLLLLRDFQKWEPQPSSATSASSVVRSP